MIESIDETTVGMLGDVRVPMGNVTTDVYTLPDGTEARGLVCALALPDGAVFVGLGSEVEVAGRRWRVIGLEAPEDDLGSVTLTDEL